MKKTITILLALLMLLSLAACGGTAADSTVSTTASAGETNSGTIEVTDLKGRTVTLPANIERVVVTFNLEEYLAVTGEAGVDKLVGWSHKYWKGRRDDAYNAYTKALPAMESIPDVGYNGDISIEAIISLQPDVVLASATGANYNALEPAFDLLHQAGIEVVFFNFHKQTIETHQQSIQLIGKVMGQEERAAELARLSEENATDYQKLMELDAQKQTPVLTADGEPRKQRREHVAQMHPAGGTILFG